MDNAPPINLTLKNGMSLAATFINRRTGHEIGVFVNEAPGARFKDNNGPHGG
jgi:hypothetical protein